MDEAKRRYIEAQFERVSTEYSEYKPKLKIIKPNAETNWIDITESQLARIRAILLEDATPKESGRRERTMRRDGRG
jgi:hypothetical protein